MTATTASRHGFSVESLRWWLLQGEPTVLASRPCPTDEDGYRGECGGEGPGRLGNVEIIGRHFPRCSYAVDGTDVSVGIEPAPRPVFEVVRHVYSRRRAPSPRGDGTAASRHASGTG